MNKPFMQSRKRNSEKAGLYVWSRKYDAVDSRINKKDE